MIYSPRTTPRIHQIEAQRRLTLRPSKPSSADVMAWLMEMGTGKSKVICDEFGAREEAKDLQDLLIVAPAGSYLNWCEDKSEDQQSQFKAHLSEDLFNRMAYGAWISGGKVSTKKSLIELLKIRDRPRALLVNVEALSSVQAAKDLCSEFLATSGRRAMMAVDESTVCKNPRAERTKTVLDLGGLAAVRRILTGLVTPRSPLDLFSQFEFLDWRILGFQSYWAFRARYAIMKEMVQGGRKFKIVVNYRNVEELQEKIAPYSYRVLKEDCLDLPAKIYQTREVELTPEQKRIYKELKEYATSVIQAEDHVTATSVITQMIRMHQLICGHVVDDTVGKVHDVPSRRIDALLEILEEHSGKAIIWVTYRHALDKIIDRLVKEYGQGSVAAFHGGNRSTRGEDEKRFLGNPTCRFMVSTPAAGGRGNTWTAASLVIYYANSYDLELRSQSEDRSHRDGLKHAVTYVDLVAPGTVDEKIIKALRSKIDMATAITGETYREWLI